MSLPRNPDIGGMPDRFMAGTKNSTAISGAARISPPSRVTDVVPVRRSTIPTTRNRLVCTVMWCTT